MNERISELAEQAGWIMLATPDNPNADIMVLIGPNIEKFAEMIVRECAGVCDDERDSTDSDFGKLVAEGCALKIMERFGVEE